MKDEEAAWRNGNLPSPEQKGTVLGRQGQAIRYWLYGTQGIPIVLCNGLFSGVTSWTPFVQHFARTHRLLLWEYQGQGVSTGTTETQQVTVRTFSEDALQLVDGVGIQQAIFIGQGFGVQVILELYRNSPETVMCMVGVNGAEEGRLSSIAPFNKGPFVARTLERILLPLGVPFWKVFRAVWNAALPFHQREERQEAETSLPAAGKGRAWLEQVSRTDPGIGLRILSSMLFYHPGSLLPQMCIPVLILGGSEDRFIPSERYVEMARRIPGSRLVMLQGCSHQALEEDPRAVNRFVEEFLLDQGMM